MRQFRGGQSRVLIATDVWGRGLDVQQVPNSYVSKHLLSLSFFLSVWSSILSSFIFFSSVTTRLPRSLVLLDVSVRKDLQRKIAEHLVTRILRRNFVRLFVQNSFLFRPFFRDISGRLRDTWATVLIRLITGRSFYPCGDSLDRKIDTHRQGHTEEPSRLLTKSW